MQVAALHFLLPSGTGAPEWVHLVPAGTFTGADGRGPYTLADPAAVIAASLQAGQRLVVDENHATDLTLSTGGAAPARGWIVEMQARADGIWGRVEWTGEGRRMLDALEYRGISPVFMHHEKSGVITKVLRASLTNVPNLTLTALHTQGNPMDIAPLLTALGLQPTATIPDAVAVVAALHATQAQTLTAIGAAAGLTGTPTPETIVTALQVRAAQPDRLTELVALQTQVAQLQEANLRTAAEAAIDAAIAAGKPIPPTTRADFIAKHMKDPAGTQEWLNIMPSLHTGGFGGRTGAAMPASGGLTAADAQVAALMGIDPKVMVGLRARQGDAA